MNWIEILGLGASAASGGLFGVIGAGISAFFKAKQKKVEMEEKAADRKHELDRIRLQMEVTSQGGSWDAMTATHRAEQSLNERGTSQWVADAKSLFRPVLTVFLWLAVYVEITIVLQGSLEKYLISSVGTQTLFDPVSLVELIRYIVYSTVFSATTATTWWFGERALSLPQLKHR